MRLSSILPLTLCLMSAAAGCATLDERSVGRTDRLKGSPFYVTYRASAQPAGKTLLLPVVTDALTRSEYLTGGRGEALAPLLAAINTRMAGEACCVWSGPLTLPDGEPQLYIGSLEGEHAPMGTGIERMAHEEYAPMIAHLLKPQPKWLAAVREQMTAHGASRAIFVQLGFTQYPKADRGAFGKKVVLGTQYEEPIRVLSAVDKPVEVIQLTGVVIDANGQITRVGAEGITGEDAPFWVQVLEAGRDIDPGSIDRLVSQDRRADLPGTPLKWEAALTQLLFQLQRAR